MSLYIYTRNARRGLVRQLARKLGIKCVDSTLRPKPRSTLICWGNSAPPEWLAGRATWVLNTPTSVATMSNKISTFRALTTAGVNTLDWVLVKSQAQQWLDGGSNVYARHSLTGHSGHGLELILAADGAVLRGTAPLYTKDYGTPFKEYRVHVVNGAVIDHTMKQRIGADEVAARDMILPDDRTRLQIRTYDNGWVFTRNDIKWHHSIGELAVRAVQAVGADFGAVDIVAKWRAGECTDMRVIEINSAPALRSETTLNAYAAALRPLL